MLRFVLQMTLITLGITLLALGGAMTYLRQQPATAALIAYTSDTGKICFQFPENRSRRCFGGKPDAYEQPSFSPDGRWLIFHTRHQHTNAWEMYVRDMRNGDQKVLRRYAQEPYNSYEIYWFPDSTRFLFEAPNRNYYAIVHLDGTMTRLAWSENLGILDGGVTLSPDGEWIAYSFPPPGQMYAIFKRRVDGSELQILTDQEQNAPTWSPDGEWIAFSSPLSGGDSNGINRMRSDGSANQVVLGIPFSRAMTFLWFPDSEWLLYLNAEGQMYRVSADGTQQHWLSDQVFAWIDPAISPDGSQIVFYADDQGGLQMMNADGTQRYVLTPELVSDPVWSPHLDLPWRLKWRGQWLLIVGGLCLLAAVLNRRSKG